jgi:hypothetical protein
MGQFILFALSTSGATTEGGDSVDKKQHGGGGGETAGGPPIANRDAARIASVPLLFTGAA